MMMKFGLAGIQDAIAAGKARSAATTTKASSSEDWEERLKYFAWREDGEKKILRFVSEIDEVVTGDFAEFVLCKDGKKQSFLIPDPSDNLVLKYGGKVQDYITKQLVDPVGLVLKSRTAAIAVLREEVPDPDKPGKTKIVDHIDDVKIGNQIYKARWFGIVRQGHGNFWDRLVGMCSRYGTLLDRDYEIIRRGTDRDTRYDITPIDPPADDPMRDPAVVQERYRYGKPWDSNDPERYMYCPQDMQSWADYYSGEERVKFWLGDKSDDDIPPWEIKSESGGFSPSSLRDRLISHKS